MGDRNEIFEVLARYARALEERDGKAVAALFASDGESHYSAGMAAMITWTRACT
jgi:hypothetical protein